MNIGDKMPDLLGKPVYTKDLDKDTRKHLAEYFQGIIQETINKNSSLV